MHHAYFHISTCEDLEDVYLDIVFGTLANSPSNTDGVPEYRDYFMFVPKDLLPTEPGEVCVTAGAGSMIGTTFDTDPYDLGASD